MSKEDMLSVDGQVTDTTGGGNYVVTLSNGVKILAKLSGKMKRFKIHVIAGDKVIVSMSPYDTSHGLITHRHKG
jgi:translation initiation factor IF-1